MGEKVLNLIGLARRGGFTDSGDAAVRTAIQNRRAKLIIIAEDAAARTGDAFRLLAGDAGIPVVVCGTKENLGRILGKTLRSVVAVTDNNFARGIAQAMERREA